MDDATVARAERPGRTRHPRLGLFSVGLAAYWPQFPGLRPALERYHARVRTRLEAIGADVVDVGLISDAEEAMTTGTTLRGADVDLLVCNLATYATSTQVIPVAQRVGAPVLVIDMQPDPAMDHPNTGTAKWLEYCGVCSLPEMSAALRRSGIAFRSVSGHLDHEPAWRRIERWVQAATVAAAYRHGRFGMLGHLYPGMLDIATDVTLLHGQLGGHVEILEMDDLRVRVEAATEAEVAKVEDEARATFELDATVAPDDLAWACRVAVGQQRLVDDFGLDALAYYYRGLDGGLYERIAAGMILGCSLLTAAGVPCAGEYDIRTALAMLALDRLGAGGSFTEFQALNFADGVVEMGHDGPAHLGISDGRPVLRGLDVYHGKRGFGVSVEFGVKKGPVTMCGMTQSGQGRLALVLAEGEVVGGPQLQIGNTTSRVDVARDPGDFVDEWCAVGPAHHWALGMGHHAETLQRAAELVGIDSVRI